MTKVQYRITTVSSLDGKPVTKVFKSCDEALATYEHLLRNSYHLFATFGRRTVSEGGTETFLPLHASLSASAGRAQARGDIARVRQMILEGTI
jgi:hypothetical protein